MNYSKYPDWIKPMAYRELCWAIDQLESGLLALCDPEYASSLWALELRNAENIHVLHGLEWAAGLR
jgi:hypothetical protein